MVRFCHRLQGTKLARPSQSSSESQPIGRGTVQDLNGEQGSGQAFRPGARSMDQFPKMPGNRNPCSRAQSSAIA